MRSTLLDGSKEDRATFDRLLKNADVFFSNRRPGYLERYGLTAEELSQKKPGLIHAKVVLHGEQGPWSNRVGSMRLARLYRGCFPLRGHPLNPSRLPSSRFATTWSAGLAPSVFLRPCDGAPTKEEVIASSYP